jgi:hypothetical protein
VVQWRPCGYRVVDDLGAGGRKEQRLPYPHSYTRKPVFPFPFCCEARSRFLPVRVFRGPKAVNFRPIPLFGISSNIRAF